MLKKKQKKLPKISQFVYKKKHEEKVTKRGHDLMWKKQNKNPPKNKTPPK